MIKGKKVILRSLKKADQIKTVCWRNDLEIKKYLLLHPFLVTEILEEGWYANILSSTANKNLYFGIERITDSQLIGIVSLVDINWVNRNCKFGFFIGEEKDRSSGFGSEALELTINYAFNSLNLLKIYLEVAEFNLGAINLYKKKGFQIEGSLRSHFFCEGKWHNVIIMSLLLNNFLEDKSRVKELSSLK